MEFRTVVPVKPCSEKIGYKTPVIMVGSCFSDNIGGIMSERRFPVLVNPFGVLYNPFSVSLLLKRCINNESVKPEEVFEEQGIFKSFLFHSSFAAEGKQNLLDKANGSIKETADFLKTAQFLILTLGTARYYSLKENETIVANCHKQHPDVFTEKLASVEKCSAEIEGLISDLRKINPGLFVIFTISPVRYMKDGAPGTQQNKAVLFCALERWLKIPRTYYFPAYEIMMDELRDYRFYTDDMLHLSLQAVEYIYERFSEAFFTDETKDISDRIRRIILSLSHRPMFPESASYREFLAKTQKEIEALKKEWPEIEID